MRTKGFSVLILLTLIAVVVLTMGSYAKNPVYIPRPAFAREGFVASGSPAGTAFSGLLLGLPPKPQTDKHFGENALSCYAKDYWREHERTGNYSQQTNNYKQGYPDSCSSWRGEFVLGFYDKSK
jgi:hypothetical protein